MQIGIKLETHTFKQPLMSLRKKEFTMKTNDQGRIIHRNNIT